MRWLPVALACTLLAPAALAEPSESAVAAARELAREGGKLLLAGEHVQAVPKLTKAYEVVQVPTLAYHLGHALELSGRWVEAAERYREAQRLALPDTKRKTHEEAQKKAAERLRDLEPRIPKARIELAGGGTSDDIMVTLDGTEVPAALLGSAMPVDPGQHTVAARVGERRVERPFEAKASEEARVVLTLPRVQAPAPPPPAAPQPPPPEPPPPSEPPQPPPDEGSNAWMTPVGWVALGLGGVGFVVAGISGALLLSRDSDLSISCVDDVCTPSQRDDVDAFNTLRPVTTVSLIAGGVLAASGITLLLLAPGDETETALSLHPTGASLRYRF